MSTPSVPLFSLPGDSEDYFRLVIESAEEGVWMIDAHDCTTFVNQKMAAMLGFTPQEMVGKLLYDHMDDEGRARAARNVARRKQGIAEQYDFKFLRRDGTPLWAIVSTNSIFDDADQYLGALALLTDITTYKNTEAALRRSEQRYRSLVDATSQIVWTNTPDGEMDSPNPEWSSFTGQTEQEYAGYGWAGAVHPEDAQTTVEAWRQAVALSQPFVFEHRVRRADGVYRLFAIRAVPVREEDGTICEWVGIHTDITEQRAAAEAQVLMARQQRRFLRDVLASVTDGRLHLCDTVSDLPPAAAPLSAPIVLSTESGLRGLREAVREAAQRAGLSAERSHDLLTAASEAGMNAVVHAGGGEGRVGVSATEETVQVWITDAGGGIAVEFLPRATLEKGYTTAGTLGHGMKMILQTADRIFLLTSPAGTTVVLEQKRIPPGLV